MSVIQRSRSWCITTNNYTQKDLLHQTDVQYQIMGKEVGDSGTPHLQQFVYYTNARTFKSVQKSFPTSHIEKMNGTLDQAISYCEKEKDFTESGKRPEDRRGKVNEWNEIMDDINQGKTLLQITWEYPEAAIRYANGIKMMYEMHRPKYKFDILEKYGKYNQLQEFIINYVNGEIHDRHVLWIYDPQGGAGKTDLANHLMSQNNFKVFGNAKTADVAYAWDGENVIFDYSRSQESCINYGVIEDVKNGRIFSGKYQSAVKLYARPHVICFANFHPDLSKMSTDRWLIYELSHSILSNISPASV